MDSSAHPNTRQHELSADGGKEALARALQRLMALNEGYAGVTDVVACGKAAVPELGRILARTETSGIFEPRCRAISALMALGAADVVIAFLEAPRLIADPTARLGEEAVISTAARALAGTRNERVLRLLLALARRQPLGGVIEALGGLRIAEAIPGLVCGLYEDDTRKYAVAALRRHGRAARLALIRAATTPSRTPEPSSCLRGRRAAMALLAEIGLAPWQANEVRPLSCDPDAGLSAYACRACLASGSEAERAETRRRLAALLPQLSASTRDAILSCRAPMRSATSGAAPAAPQSPNSTPVQRSSRPVTTLRLRGP
jgi:hypothetical protein